MDDEHLVVGGVSFEKEDSSFAVLFQLELAAELERMSDRVVTSVRVWELESERYCLRKLLKKVSLLMSS